MTLAMPDLAPETEARMRPLWAAADRDLRRDPHVLADLAELAARTVSKLARSSTAREAEEGRVQALERGARDRRPVPADDVSVERQREAQRARRAARSPEKVAADRARARQRANDRYANDPAFRDAAIARSKARHAAKVANRTPDLDQLIASGALD